VTAETGQFLREGGRKLYANLKGQVEAAIIIGESLRHIREHEVTGDLDCPVRGV
jgi:hypothetical protein